MLRANLSIGMTGMLLKEAGRNPNRGLLFNHWLALIECGGKITTLLKPSHVVVNFQPDNCCDKTIKTKTLKRKKHPWILIWIIAVIELSIFQEFIKLYCFNLNMKNFSKKNSKYNRNIYIFLVLWNEWTWIENNLLSIKYIQQRLMYR